MAVTLVIDTATEACSSALLADGRTIARRHEQVGRGHAERLVPQVAELLAEAGLDRVDAVLVDCGPGSFTGVRVGLAAARGFGLAWNISVHGYSSLALIAAASGEGPTIAVALTGGHGELFVQRFRREPLAPLADLASLPPGEAARAVDEDEIVGSGAEALIAARGRGRAIAASPRAADARLLPASLAALPPTPLYGRLPDAKRPAA